MERASIKQKAKQLAVVLVGLMIVSIFIVPPLLAPSYDVKQGQFEARILSSATGMGMAARPVVRARVEDETGRIFWVRVPSASVVAPETKLYIQVRCETDAFERCMAQYWGPVKPGEKSS